MDKKLTFYRSAVTGKFVSKAFAEANPDITFKQVIIRRINARVAPASP